MDNKKELKETVLKHLYKLVDEAIDIATNAIESAKESRNSDTKSSAGDKYETGREMMQVEIDKNTVQLHKALQLREELSRIKPRVEYTNACFGSLVVTNQGDYFIAIGMGKINVPGENIYAISAASPIGKLLLNKRSGDTFEFQTREYIIEEII